MNELFINLTIFMIAFAIMLKSADYFVGGAVGVAYLMKMPKMVIGIVFVGLATTSPELFVSAESAYLGHPEIALGNGIGSVIADDALCLPIGALIIAMLVRRRTLKNFLIFWPPLVGLSFLFALDANITRLEGFVLVLALVGYFFSLLRMGRRETDRPSRSKDQNDRVILKEKTRRKILLSFILGAAGVVVCARLVIESGLNIAEYFGIPEVILGLTMIAIGTSLPELVTCITAARKGETEIATGDILGADVLNILLIIGTAAIVNPIGVSPHTIRFAYPWMILVVLVMLLFMRTGYKVTRKEGFFLIFLYFIYVYQMAKFFVG